jgi:hypothetical protein
MWDRYHMIGFLLSHIASNAISNLELEWSYKSLRSKLVLPLATTLSNTGQRESALRVDAIKKQLALQNQASLALDGWTSTNILTITLVIANYMDRKWAL